MSGHEEVKAAHGEWAAAACPLCAPLAPEAAPPIAEVPAPTSTDSVYSLCFRPSAPLKIFLSYGHDRYQQLAFHLKLALQRRGHTVWVDVERLAPGIDWEDGIAGALTWVKDAQQDGRVLLLMTPHALRRPDGYCLNEIARAAASRLNIFPVLVADSEPPPSIAMLPYFDLRDCVPTSKEELALARDSDQWTRLMATHVHSERLWAKAQRLFALLELFEDMSGYGVPAVGGIDNLGLFAAYDPAHHRLGDSRGSSARRLLARASCESLGLLADSGNSSRSLDHSSSGRTIPNIEEAKTTPSEDEAPVTDLQDLPSTRYVFSFDDSCYVLAKQLYDDLLALGFHVYPPPPPVATYDAESSAAHEDALAWAAEVGDGKVLLLVTPESVGRPSGVSLNDVSAAMAAGLGFVPLMVRQNEIPLSICRIQWLDMTDCLVYNGLSASGKPRTAVLNPVRYAARKDQLVTALRGQLDHEGQQARLFSLLSPFSFQQQISKLTYRFTGRDWLFKRVQQWINDSSSGTDHRVFWITGQIGSGKTSVAARMVQTFPEIAAFHFALQEDDQTHIARRCVLSLAYQLTTQLPEYGVFLQSREPLEEIVPVSTFHTLVTHLLVEPLNTIKRPAKPLILLIDGLECIVSGATLSAPGLSLGGPPPAVLDGCLVTMLPSLVARLPSWVRLVLLSREDHDVMTRLQTYTPSIVIDHFAQENECDIKKFVGSALAPKKSLADIVEAATAETSGRSRLTTLARHVSFIRSPRNRPGVTTEQIETIARRAEGLFLYAANIVQGIEEGRVALNELDKLPTGMGGCLRQFFDSHFDDNTYKTTIRPALEVLCAAYEPLTMDALAKVLEWDIYEQREVVATFGSLLYVAEGDNFVRPFHSSVLEWVQNSRAAGRFYADVSIGHERLGLWAAREYEAVVQSSVNRFINLNYELETATGDVSNRMHVYIVRHACNHLMQATGVECMQLVTKFSSDERFQLARRLLSLRTEGLESFFHGDIDRDQAQRLLLQNARLGSFLIRYTARQKAYCASFIDKIDEATQQPKFRHNLIYHLANGAYSVVPPAQVTAATTIFPDLVSFVEEYQRKGVLCAAIARRSPLNREISATGN